MFRFKRNPLTWSHFRFLLDDLSKTRGGLLWTDDQDFSGKLNSLVDLEEHPGMLIAEFNLNLLVIPVGINVSILRLSPPLNDALKYTFDKHI